MPPWILFKNISFGSAINIFRFLSTKYKIEVAKALLPTHKIADKDKIELLINALEGIRRFRNCAAHSLNFFGCRSRYNLPGNILYTLLPAGIFKREKGQITTTDKNSLKGVYGVLIMTALLLNDKLLVSALTYECRGIFKPTTNPNETMQTLIERLNNLKQQYKVATELSLDFEDKLSIINASIH